MFLPCQPVIKMSTIRFVIIGRPIKWRGEGGIGMFLFFFFLKGRLFLMFSHSGLLSILLGPDPSTTLSAALDPLSKVQCNHHLVSFQDILDEEYISLSLAIINYINQNLKD